MDAETIYTAQVSVGQLIEVESELEKARNLLRTERRRFHRAIIKLAGINGDLEDRVCTLEEMLRLSENLRQADHD